MGAVPRLMEVHVRMKNKLNITLLLLWVVSTAACVTGVLYTFDLWWLVLCAVPSFCAQLLICRLTRRGWLRAVPALPAVMLLAGAMFYFVRDDGWDRLAALIFALAGAVSATGVFFGWVAFLPRKTHKKDNNEQ